MSEHACVCVPDVSWFTSVAVGRVREGDLCMTPTSSSVHGAPTTGCWLQQQISTLAIRLKASPLQLCWMLMVFLSTTVLKGQALLSILSQIEEHLIKVKYAGDLKCYCLFLGEAIVF